ncbi:uncharacterized protein LOC105018237 [Esox lucius]|nr:uncharacterized protein LOC105018237 [Esox lucius]XP_010881818.1 uncharacterized protein LOC105018237 [Esox lucius]
MESHATPEADIDTFPMDQSSEEFQLLVAYCERRKRKRSGLIPQFEGYKIYPQGPAPSKHMPEAGRQRVMMFKKVAKGKGSLSGVAERLTQIADTVDITQRADTTVAIRPCVGHIEADGTDDLDDVILKIVELLKVSGDQLNEKIKSNPTLQKHFQTSFTYGLFEKVTTTLVQGMMGGDPVARHGDPAPEKSVQREEIALVCEVTSRLSALDLHPMNQAMGFGSRYLQQHHTAWVKKQGGWNKVFDSEDTD